MQEKIEPEITTKDITMEEKQKSFEKREAVREAVRNVVILVLMLVFVYCISLYTLFNYCGRFSFMPEWFWEWSGFCIILGFDVAWILVIRFLIKKNIKLRIILTLLGLTFSAAVLSSWMLETYLMPVWFFNSIGLGVILAFGTIWTLIMKLLFRKHREASMFFMFLGLAVSTAILACWIVEKLSLFHHIFG